MMIRLYAIIVTAYTDKPFTHYRTTKRNAEALARRVRRDGWTAVVVRVK